MRLAFASRQPENCAASLSVFTKEGGELGKSRLAVGRAGLTLLPVYSEEDTLPTGQSQRLKTRVKRSDTLQVPSNTRRRGHS